MHIRDLNLELEGNTKMTIRLIKLISTKKVLKTFINKGVIRATVG